MPGGTKSVYNIHAFLSLNPTLCHYVQTLSLSTDDLDYYVGLTAIDLAGILDLLPHLRQLFLWNVIVPYSSEKDLPEDKGRILQRLVCAFKSTHRDGSEVPIDTPADLLASLNLFVRVDEVAIYGAYNYPRHAKVSGDRVHRCNIGSLIVDEEGDFLPYLLEILRHSVDTTTLHSLRLRAENMMTLMAISGFMRSFSPGLKSLTLEADAYWWEPRAEDVVECEYIYRTTVSCTQQRVSTSLGRPFHQPGLSEMLHAAE